MDLVKMAQMNIGTAGHEDQEVLNLTKQMTMEGGDVPLSPWPYASAWTESNVYVSQWNLTSRW